MKDLFSIITVYVVIVLLVLTICLGFGVPFSLSKASGVFAFIILLAFAKKIIFD